MIIDFGRLVRDESEIVEVSECDLNNNQKLTSF